MDDGEEWMNLVRKSEHLVRGYMVQCTVRIANGQHWTRVRSLLSSSRN